jgi:hypothetical protein
MPKVKAFSIDGIECYFHTNDNDPPHFHAKKRDSWELRVWFLETDEDFLFEYDWHRKEASGKDFRRLAAKVKKHRALLLQEWQKARGN